MSGCSGSAKCPNCGEDMDSYCDWKPFDYSTGRCLHCGFFYDVVTDKMTLEEVNAERKEYELEPLKELKKEELDKEIDWPYWK